MALKKNWKGKDNRIKRRNVLYLVNVLRGGKKQWFKVIFRVVVIFRGKVIFINGSQEQRTFIAEQLERVVLLQFAEYVLPCRKETILAGESHWRNIRDKKKNSTEMSDKYPLKIKIFIQSPYELKNGEGLLPLRRLIFFHILNRLIVINC